VDAKKSMKEEFWSKLTVGRKKKKGNVIWRGGKILLIGKGSPVRPKKRDLVRFFWEKGGGGKEGDSLCSPKEGENESEKKVKG